MATGGDRLKTIRSALTRREWARLGAFGGAVFGINAVGWTMLAIAVIATHSAIGLGVGVTAWIFGLRHAFDADHISAIDNTTRKLMADGKRPLGVGFFFSLGHSTIVFGLTFAIAIAAKLIAGQVGGSSQLKFIGGYIGTGVSGFFLYLIAAVNLVILFGIFRIFREMRQGRYDEETLEKRLQERGFLNRLLGPLARSIRNSWQMYPIGVLFGLGFDTATEVGLLALAGGAAVGGLPWFATLSLPILFAGGMTLMDTADGAFMNVAYGWAFSKPVRKVFYNLAITGLSVAVALLVGTMELASILAQSFNLSGGIWNVVAKVDLNQIGFIIVGMFVVTWALAIMIWRFGRIEQRWALAPASPKDHHDITERKDAA
jgi:high-affinity nickel-transport protein